MVKLSDLEPELLATSSCSAHTRAYTVAGADGVAFRCPKCFKGGEGHHVYCWRQYVAYSPGTMAPGRWYIYGKGVDDMTLSADPSNTITVKGCGARFTVTRGEVALLPPQIGD